MRVCFAILITSTMWGCGDEGSEPTQQVVILASTSDPTQISSSSVSTTSINTVAPSTPKTFGGVNNTTPDQPSVSSLRGTQIPPLLVARNGLINRPLFVRDQITPLISARDGSPVIPVRRNQDMIMPPYPGDISPYAAAPHLCTRHRQVGQSIPRPRLIPPLISRPGMGGVFPGQLDPCLHYNM